MLVASPALGTVALGTLDVTDELSPSTLALGSDAPEETLPPPLPPFSSVAGAALKACGYRTERDPRRSTRRTNNADVGVCLISTSSTPASTAKQSARFVRADNRPDHLGSGAPVCRQHGRARTTHTKHFLARQVVRARAGLLGALQHLARGALPGPVLHQWCSTPRTYNRTNRENAGDDDGPGSPEFLRL